jgi:hypothetical protein
VKEQEQKMRTYIAFYRGREIQVQAESSYAAQLKAAAEFRTSKTYEVTVVVLGQPIDTASL